MIALSALIFAIGQSKGGPADFFPSTEGLQLTYQDSLMEVPMIRTVLAPDVRSDMTLIPIETSLGGRVAADIINYRIDDKGVYMVWMDKKGQPIPQQQPLFLWASGDGKWSFTGLTRGRGFFEPLVLIGETRTGGIRTILGNKVDTIIVKLDATISSGDAEIKDHQELVLARGIGIVEEQETSIYARKKWRRTLKLIGLKSPKDK